MKRVRTPKKISRFLLCFSRSEIEQFCRVREVDVLHITANVMGRITGSFDYDDVEFGSPVPRVFEVDEDNPYFTVIDGVLFSKDKKTLVAFPKRDEDYEYSIPDGVTCIGYEAFADQRHLTSIHIPDSVEIIESRAFLNCYALKEFILPASVKKFSYFFGFLSGMSLEQIIVSKDNDVYTSVDGVLFSKDMKMLLYYPPKKKDDFYCIPEGVESIGTWAFKDVFDLCSIKFPPTLKEIEDQAFFNCPRLAEFEGIPNDLLIRMSLTKKDARRLKLPRIDIGKRFIGSPIREKLFSMREQVRLEYQDKQDVID